MTPEATIVICAHNSVTRIGPVLESLANQVPSEQAFEVLVVDNASTDGTGEYVLGHPASRRLREQGVEVRVVPEPIAGLMRARLRGAQAARTSILCYLDDDTVAGPGYVAAGIAGLREGHVGQLVSRVYPDYLEPPPAAVERRRHLLAVNYTLGEAPIDFPPSLPIAPTLGAGMWIRRDLLVDALTSGVRTSGRIGGQLIQGDDLEIGACVARRGFTRRYLPALVLHHQIGPGRFRIRYFMRLIIGSVRADVGLRERYLGEGHDLPRRARAVARLLSALAAVPGVLLLRPDGAREALFVLAARCAEVLGPTRSVMPPAEAHLSDLAQAR